MGATLSIGLAVSPGGPLILLLAAKTLRFNSLSLPGRLSLWLLALIALLLAAYGAGASWLTRIGVRPFGWSDFLGAVVVVIVSLVGAIFLQLLQRKLGIKNTEGRSCSGRSMTFPRRTGSSWWSLQQWWRRCSIAATR